MLISPAYAQAAGGQGFGFEQMLPLILVFVVFYFLLIRPQQKRQKEHKAMLSALKRGDHVVTGGGIVGKITKATDFELTVEIARDVQIKVTRDSVAGLYNADMAAAATPSANTEKTSEKAEGAAEGEAGEEKASGSKLRRMLGGK